jgi:hypothetical protein
MKCLSDMKARQATKIRELAETAKAGTERQRRQFCTRIGNHTKERT